MSDTYRLICISTALSPITHMSGTEGNEAILNRQAVMTSTGRRYVPMLSGNAIRHRAVREPGAMHLIEACGLKGNLSRRAANFLLHGGALSESTSRVDLTAKLEMKARLPFIRMLGGALPAAIEEGSLRVDQGILICRENESRVAAISGLDVPANLRPAEDFVAGWQYTRSDAARSAADTLDPKVDVDGETNLMIYAGQCVIPGAIFLHGFTLEHAGELEVGALLLSLSLWQSAGGSIGGMSAKGHGKLRTSVMLPSGIDAKECIADYVSHVTDNASWTAAWAGSAFNPSPKPEKKKGAKHATAESNG